MQATNIEKIKRSIFLRTLTVLFVIGSLLVATVMLPLNRDLKAKNAQQVQFIVDAKATSVDQFVSKIVNVAEQFSSRSQIRQKLVDFNQGRISRQALVEFSAPKLQDALNTSDDAVGITRLDAQGDVAVVVGEPLPDGFFDSIGRGVTQTKVYDPVEIAGQTFIVVAAPILQGDGQRAGTDVVLFRSDRLQSLVTDYGGLGRTGEAMLIYRHGDAFVSVYPSRQPYDSALFTDILTDYLNGHVAEGEIRYPASPASVISIRPLKGTNWYVVFRMDRAELNAIIDATTMRLAILSAAILIIGMLGVYRLTYPLLQTLGEELKERMRAEERVRQLNDDLERRVAERTVQLSEAKEMAEVANRAKSTFLANMSHELRTPLNAILGFSDLLGRDPNLTRDQRESLHIVNHSGEHLLELINDVLDMSKIEAGRMTLELESIDLPMLLRDTTEMLRVRADSKNLSLMLEVDASLPRLVRVDAKKLRQVLINVVSNSIKYTDEGGVSLRARARSEADGYRLEFEVEDTGCGIAKEDCNSIFEAFVQVGKSSLVTEGTGLGLPITRRFLHLMRGDINVHSRLGEGSLFVFDLYAGSAVADEVKSSKSLPRVRSIAPGQPIYRVLVVDDSEANRLLLKRILQEVGFDVREAGNGEQALLEYANFNPQLIWMDMRMPVMDGYEATGRIRQMEGGKRVKIVALTASAFTDEEGRVIEAGCDEFVRKPFRESDLFGVMKRQLGIEFVYGETGEDEAVPDEIAQIDLTRMYNGLPDELKDRLIRALDFGSVTEVDAAVGAVEATDSALATQLKRYTDVFRYTDLESLLTGGAI